MPIPSKMSPLADLANGEYVYSDAQNIGIWTDLSRDFTTNSVWFEGVKTGWYNVTFGGTALGYNTNVYTSTGDRVWGTGGISYRLGNSGTSGWDWVNSRVNVHDNLCDWIFTPNGFKVRLSSPSVPTSLTSYRSGCEPQAVTGSLILPNSTATANTTKIYRFRYWQSADLTTPPYADLRPAKRKSDGWVGMYDIIRHKFFPASTETAFTLIE